MTSTMMVGREGTTVAATDFVLTTVQPGGLVGGAPTNALIFEFVPADEAWLWRNPAMLREVMRGAEHARKGEVASVSYLGFVDADGE